MSDGADHDTNHPSGDDVGGGTERSRWSRLRIPVLVGEGVLLILITVVRATRTHDWIGAAIMTLVVIVTTVMAGYASQPSTNSKHDRHKGESDG